MIRETERKAALVAAVTERMPPSAMMAALRHVGREDPALLARAVAALPDQQMAARLSEILGRRRGRHPAAEADGG